MTTGHPLYDTPDFETFWRAYVRMHSRRGTRHLHAVATTAMLACVAQGLRTRRLRWLVAAPVIDYAIAQASHRLVQKNRTEPHKNLPRHLRAELRLYRLTLTGRMDAEVARAFAPVDP